MILDHGIECRRERLDVVDIEDREAGVLDAGSGLAEEHEILAARVGQRLQDHGVDDAEDGGVGADAERHGDDDRERVAFLLAQAARTIAHVLAEGLEQPREPGVADIVLDALDAAKRLARGAQRDLRAGATAHVFGRQHVEMELQLGVELVLHRAPANDRADALYPG